MQTRWQVTLDSNLLLLLTVGSFDPRLLRTFKRLSPFQASDLRRLQAFMRWRTLVTTAHILTEVANLANGLPELSRRGFYRFLADLIPGWTERTPEAVQLCRHPAFPNFGVTDTALAILAADTIVITEDGRLRAYLRSLKLHTYSLADIGDGEDDL